MAVCPSWSKGRHLRCPVLVRVGSNPTAAKRVIRSLKKLLLAVCPSWSKGRHLRCPVFVRVGSNPTAAKSYVYTYENIPMPG